MHCIPRRGYGTLSKSVVSSHEASNITSLIFTFFNMFGFPSMSNNVTVSEAHESMGKDGHVLLDVRTVAEVRALSAPNVLNIPLDRLESQSHKLSGFSSIHIICRSGARSGAAMNFLHGLGMTHAKNVTGGMIAWEAAKLPTK